MIRNAEELKQNISKAVRVYIIGCCLFVLVALASLWFGYYVIRYHNDKDWLLSLASAVSLTGAFLLWEMARRFRVKNILPDNYSVVEEHEYPTLFSIINEITTSLELHSIHKIYICPDATAAVFIQPQLRNIIFEPKKDLVIGLGFLTQMDDDEIRAMLYHEFGHYAQGEMNKSISVYTIGQFASSFISLIAEGAGKVEHIQLMLFTSFSLWICSRINKVYSKLAKQMEYDADDVATKYVGASTLQRALLHAACIRYNYEVVQWGIQQLQSHNIQVDNQYLALSFVGNYSRPTRHLLSEEVLRRVERLGRLETSNTISTTTVRQSVLLAAEDKGQTSQKCSALRFALWLRQGFAIYTQQRLLEKTVELEIHLDKKKHRLPFIDGSYKLLLDGKEIGKGNFIKGYNLKCRTSPGKHVLTAHAISGIISTPFEFNVEQDKSYHIEMDYILYAKYGIYDVFGEKIILNV